jgi:hypothetical protein
VRQSRPLGRLLVGLLPQPGGFEGFFSVGVHLHSRSEAVPKRPDLRETHLHLRPAVLTLPMLAGDCDHLIPGVEETRSRSRGIPTGAPSFARNEQRLAHAIYSGRSTVGGG